MQGLGLSMCLCSLKENKGPKKEKGIYGYLSRGDKDQIVIFTEKVLSSF